MFLRKINEVRAAIDSQLYNCALALALTLPDICGKVEYPNEKSSGKRYQNWFNNYALGFFTESAIKLPEESTVPIVWFSAKECWALRCSVLHAGNYDTDGIDLSLITLHAHIRDAKNYSHMARDSQFVDWDVIYICEKLCSASEEYYNSTHNKKLFLLDEVRIDTD